MGENEMPISFKMALAHNTSSMRAFLKMDNKHQDDIISKAKKVETLREMNIFVANISKGVEKTDFL